VSSRKNKKIRTHLPEPEPQAPPRKNRLLPYLWITSALILVCFAVLAIKIHSRKEITYDFSNPNIAREWIWYGAGTPVYSAEGILVRVDQPHLWLSPAPGKPGYLGPGLSWNDLPYARLVLKESPVERKAHLAWSPWSDANKIFNFPFRVPRQVRAVVVDTQSLEPWHRRMPFKGPLVQFGFQFGQNSSEAVVIKSVTLLSFPDWGDFFRLLFAEICTTEDFVPYTINHLYGVTLFGTPLIGYLGFFVAILWGIFMVRTTNQTKLGLISGALLAFVIFDAQFGLSWFNQIRYSSQRSAWHSSVDRERESRFGKEFAGLARELEQVAPRGTQVFFSGEKSPEVRGETNWMWFQLFPKYEQTDLEHADYVFYYHPRDCQYDPVRKVIERTGVFGQVTQVSADMLFESGGEVRLLKVNHA